MLSGPASQPRVSCLRALLAALCAIVAVAIGTAVSARSSGLRDSAAMAPFDATAWDGDALAGLRREVFGRALQAAACAVRSGDVADPATLTVIDYSLPSTSERLWVLDLDHREVLYHDFVAHGQGSGGNLPTHFSNDPDSHASSLGLFVTRGTYTGKNGYSLRLDGLEPGFNDHALARAIVIHGASYVSAAVAHALGRLGRSWGCPALREGIARTLIDRVKNGNLVFAYYPDPRWLTASRYLGQCAAASLHD